MRGRAIGLALAVATAQMLPLPADAQLLTPAGPSPFAEQYRADLAVPDAPAFELLKGEHGAILRPNTLQELSVALSQFRDDDGSFQVPGEIAVEFSPALLLGGESVERASYATKAKLYNLRISLATATDSSSSRPSIAAVGLRWTMVNEADLGLDPDYLADEQVTPLTREILVVYQAARDRLAEAGVPLEAPIVLDESERATVERLEDEIRARWAARHWNAESLEFALGLRASGLGDAVEDTRVDRLGLFASYATGFGAWGQIVLGGRLGAERVAGESDFTQAIGLGARIYLGSNRHKAFLELQESIREGEDNELLLNGGAELKVADWIWAVASIGLEDQPTGSSGSQATAAFSLKTALPRL